MSGVLSETKAGLVFGISTIISRIENIFTNIPINNLSPTIVQFHLNEHSKTIDNLYGFYAEARKQSGENKARISTNEKYSPDLRIIIKPENPLPHL